VLVHGAAGGVGLAAVDYAKVLGCKVIAASASDEKLAIIQKEYAPDAVVNVTGGFRERVKELTGGRGADVIYDPVGGDVFDESLRCIAFGGRILSNRLHLGPPARAAGQHRPDQGVLRHGRARRRIRPAESREGPREQTRRSGGWPRRAR
jgi:NADPH:quinone reductase-like Zn-dependent oxidoreductase